MRVKENLLRGGGANYRSAAAAGIFRSRVFTCSARIIYFHLIILIYVSPSSHRIPCNNNNKTCFEKKQNYFSKKNIRIIIKKKRHNTTKWLVKPFCVRSIKMLREMESNKNKKKYYLEASNNGSAPSLPAGQEAATILPHARANPSENHSRRSAHARA